MIFLLSILLATLFVLSCGKVLKRHPLPFYLAATAIAIGAVILTWAHVRMPSVVATYLWPMVSRGGLAGACFVIVMVTGACPPGSALSKRLLPIRGQLSILASILTLGHNVAYGKTYFVKLFTAPDSLPVYQLLAAVCSLLMLVIMLPLFVTSFLSVRKRMKAKSWKRLQRFAYLFYALLGTHILLLTIPGAYRGRSGYRLTVFVYAALFFSYGVCRMLKYVAVKKKQTAALARRQAVGTACSVAAALLLVLGLAGAGMMQEKAAGHLPAEAETAVGTGDVSQTAGTEGLSEGSSDGPSDQPSSDVERAGRWRDGVFTGVGMGMNGEISVNVTIRDDVIVDVTVQSCRDDEPYWTDAQAVIERILAGNRADVDTVSGATYSSGGIIDAVADALNKASASSAGTGN